VAAPTHTFCGQPVSEQQLQLIGEVVAQYRQLSRLELANTLCELLQWYRPNGRLKSSECRIFLEQLQEQSLIKLPALRHGRPPGSTTAIAETGITSEPIQGSLDTFQPINLRRVILPEEQALWRELIHQHHYLGYRVPFGAHIRYFIESGRNPAVTLGCIQFSSPAWRMKARDRWIGWDAASQKAALQRVINNSRFLILPWVKIPNLASHLLSKAVNIVVQDWEKTYAIRPCLVETLVDIERYSGHCYRAANWLEVGITSGRGRQDRHHLRHGHSPKRIFLYPIQADAKKLLCQQSPT
jgi:hypothetical protein